jgi:hypothetical protein
MTITVRYVGRDYDPSMVRKRYVAKGIGGGPYRWCEVGDDRRFDIRQGVCDADDLPEDIRQQCDNYTGALYACEWPLKEPAP